MNSLSILEGNIGGYLKIIAIAYNMNYELLYTYSRHEEHIMAILTRRHAQRKESNRL